MSRSEPVQSLSEEMTQQLRTIQPSKVSLRDELESDIAEFLSKGGVMHEEPQAYDDPNDRRARINYGKYHD